MWRTRWNDRLWRARWWIAGGIFGAMVVSGAVVAVASKDDRAEGSVGRVPSVDQGSVPDEEDARARWDHEWPEEYGGPVWITLDTPDGVQRTITITWGPWQRRVVHSSAEERSYLFSKQPNTLVPITIEVDPPAHVIFESGDPPADAEDINEGWTRIP